MPSTTTSRLEGTTTSVAVKAPCRLKTTANHALTGLTAIDGVTPADGDRVLVGSQTNAVGNGIYVAYSGAWVRALDFDGSLDVVCGTIVFVHSGSTNAGTFWRVTTADEIIIGTSSIAWASAPLVDNTFDGAVVVTDFYTASDGLNYLPAFRAAYAFAKASGIKKMRSGLPWGNIEWWAPTLSMANSFDAFDVAGPCGFLTISHTVDIDFEFCTINCKAYNGGSITTVTQAITGNAAWRGQGINVIGGTAGTSSFGIKGVSLRNLTLDGGSDRVSTGSYAGDIAYSDYLSNQGFRIQDTGVENLYFENVTIKRFRGELFYLGQLSNTAKVTLVNCNGYSTNQAALNPSSGNLTVIGGNFGDAPICAESLGGIGQTYIGTRFFDSWQGSFLGAAGFTPLAITMYHYTVPTNSGSEDELPWLDFKGVVFDNCGAISLANYIRGSVRMQDCYITLIYTALCNKMVDLDIDAVIHKKQYTSLVSMVGPPTLTTAISGGFPAVYLQPFEDIKLKVNVTRTAYALANSIALTQVLSIAGYIKQESCQIIVTGDIDALNAAGDLRVGKVSDATGGTSRSLPRIYVESNFATGAYITWSATNKAISPTGPTAILNQNSTAGTYDITFTNAMDTANGYNYAHGQRLRCIYSGFTTAGTVMRFLTSGWTIPRTIKLRAREDWIEFSFNKYTGKWCYEAHCCGAERLTGSATYDAPNIVAAGTATTTVTVTGAVLGDKVVAVTFGVSLAALTQTAYVSAADTVTIVLYNPTAGAVDLASTTVNVEVEKA